MRYQVFRVKNSTREVWLKKTSRRAGQNPEDAVVAAAPPVQIAQWRVMPGRDLEGKKTSSKPSQLLLRARTVMAPTRKTSPSEAVSQVVHEVHSCVTENRIGSGAGHSDSVIY